MAVTNPARAITVEEYLRTSYSPDCDYVDGHIEERHLGERKHSRLQGLVFALLFGHESDWGIYVLPEQRVQVKPTQFRVPDICVTQAEQLREEIIHEPPMICIEILSPDDTFRQMRRRINDYLEMGVVNVWLLDPELRNGYICTPTGENQPPDGKLTVPGTEIVVDLADLFAKLD